MVRDILRMIRLMRGEEEIDLERPNRRGYGQGTKENDSVYYLEISIRGIRKLIEDNKELWDEFTKEIYDQKLEDLLNRLNNKK